MGRLTVKGLARLTAPGRYPDGNTLYLFVQHSGARSWVQRLVVDGRRRDIGLGSAKYVTLAQARQQAYENRVAARRGDDPFARTPQHRIPTFRVACDKAAQGRQWKGRSSEARRVALESYARSLMDRRVDRIGREDVLRCLLPIWTAKAATARKVRSWIRAALAWAQAHGHVEINYAGEAIAGALPVVKTNRDHHTALPYGEVGAALQAIDASAAASNVKGCLKFYMPVFIDESPGKRRRPRQRHDYASVCDRRSRHETKSAREGPPHRPRHRGAGPVAHRRVCARMA